MINGAIRVRTDNEFKEFEEKAKIAGKEPFTVLGDEEVRWWFLLDMVVKNFNG